MIGGYLSFWSFRLPAFIAAMFSLISCLGVYFYLPESLPKEKRDNKSSIFVLFPISTIYNAFQISQLRPFMLLKFLYGFVFTLYESFSGIQNKFNLGIEIRVSSYLLGYVAFIFASVQGGGIKTLTRKFHENTLIIFAAAIVAISLLCYALARNMIFLMIALTLFGFGCGILNTLIQSNISKLVEQSELGGTLGISASIGSLTRVFAPIVGGFLIDNSIPNAASLLGSAIMTVTAIFSYYSLTNTKINTQ